MSRLTVTIENEPRPLVNLTKTMALLGVCSGGSIASPVILDPGTDVDAEIGYGPGPTLIKAIHAEAPGTRIVWQKITGGVVGVIGSVTETPSGTGPLIAFSGAPYDSYKFAVKVVKGGPVGTAVVRVATDGATYGDDIHTKAELPAAVTGTIDLTGVTLADLNTTTVIFTSDVGGPITVTFTTPTSVQDVVDQMNTQITAGPDEAVATLVSGKYVKLASATLGGSSTLSLGAGTAHTLLGLSGGPFTGSPSTYVIPNTGVTVTFPATSDYVVDTVYTASATQPRFSVAASTTAYDTLRDWAKAESGIPQTLGVAALLVDPADAAETRQFANAVSSRRGEFFADYLFPQFHMGADLHVASATPATNNTNIATADVALKAAMAGHVDYAIDVSAGDCYVAGAYGSMRRSVMFWRLLDWARERISSDPGDRSKRGFSIIDTRGPDGVTMARNEDTAIHKLRTNGFTVAYREAGLSYIARGVTRANGAVTPDFVHSGVVNAALLAARQLVPYARLFINTDPFLTASGRILPSVADAIEGAGNVIVVAALINEAHVSAGRVTVDRTEVISTTNNLTISAELQAKGQILTVSLKVGMKGTVTDPLLVAAAA